MIEGLKGYPKYKSSGAPWLGDVPAHWTTKAIRHLGRIAGGMTPSMANTTFWGGDVPWVTPKDMKKPLIGDSKVRLTHAALEDTSLRTVPPGTVMLVVRGMILAKRVPIAVATRPVTINQDMKAIIPNGAASGRYIALVLESATDAFAPLIDEAGHGTRRLPTERWRDVVLPVPPPDEQAAVVRFLDHADQRIRRYIAAKQKLIKLLDEQKQAIIHRAVTRGFDPKVGLRPSGVGWLGDVPEHWAVVRFKFVARRIVDCLHATPNYSSTGTFPAIRTADIAPGLVRVTSARRIEAEEYARWTERLEPAAGDILYSREGERFGIAACVPAGVRLCISQRMMVFRIRPEHNPTFVMWLLNSQQVYAQACQDVMGATAPHVNVSTIRNYAMAVPARQEQDALVAEIDSLTATFGSATSGATREIALLREYRTRLIADVVTGKLDVRAAAAALPDEAGEAPPIDEVEPSEDDADAPEDDAP